jgi:hypothetical protein
MLHLAMSPRQVPRAPNKPANEAVVVALLLRCRVSRYARFRRRLAQVATGRFAVSCSHLSRFEFR